MTHKIGIAYGCGFCKDRGVYLATLKGDLSSRYAFRCHCVRGEVDERKKIPQYKQCHADEGFKFYEIDWAKKTS